MQKFQSLKNSDLGLLFVRIALGSVFIAHGLQKLQGLEGTIGFFASLGMPAFMAYVVTIIEVLGGLFVLLGVFTEIAGLSLAVVMIGAIYTVKMSKGFVGGYEFDLTLLLIALTLVVSGAGKYSISKLFKKNEMPMGQM